MPFSLPKSKRIKSRDLAKSVFNSGKKKNVYPVLAFYTDSEKKKVMFSVSKRKYRRAVDRNRIKRVLREAYRMNQFDLAEDKAVCFVFIGKSLRDTEKVKEALPELIAQINGKDEDGID